MIKRTYIIRKSAIQHISIFVCSFLYITSLCICALNIINVCIAKSFDFYNTLTISSRNYDKMIFCYDFALTGHCRKFSVPINIFWQNPLIISIFSQ